MNELFFSRAHHIKIFNLYDKGLENLHKFKNEKCELLGHGLIRSRCIKCILQADTKNKQIITNSLINITIHQSSFFILGSNLDEGVTKIYLQFYWVSQLILVPLFTMSVVLNEKPSWWQSKNSKSQWQFYKLNNSLV